MFEPDFKGQVDLIPVELREGFNLEIVGNFRVPKRDVLRAPVPEGEKAILADLGKFEKRIPKKHVEKKQVKKTTRGHGKEKAEGSVVPPLVSQAAVSGAAAGGTPAGPPVVGKKREPEQKAAGGGEPKRRKLQSKRAAPAQKKPAIAVEPEDAGYSLFDAPFSPSHTTDAGAGVPKEPAAPSVKVVPDPPVQVEETVEKTATQIFDTVDSSNNLISPTDGDGLDLRFSDAGKQKSDVKQQKSPTAEKELTNAKEANAALGKEKAAAEAVAVKAQQAEARAAKEAGARAAKALEEAKERESRSAKALEEANAEQTRLKQVVSSLQDEVQTREVAVTDLTAHVSVAEERANVAVEARDALTSSLQQLEADREWMRSQGIAHVSIL
ncbi:uncharacterized protein LOC118485034 [Helianthus annuus]|uniref:uncharacterized protein LOC118485034 n=1 Tax=Helianthus annuus TaxID=4232 RepID=UPI0016534136|nr:uncharacterized protein LOC118485034 [Helianthus annuus]